MANQTDAERILDGAYERLGAHAKRNPEWKGTIIDLPDIDGREKACAILLGAVGQIGNGGLFQYVDNGVAHRTAGNDGVPACIAAGAIVEAGRAVDPEVADRLLLLLRGAATARNRDDLRRLSAAVDANGLATVTTEMFALGHDRVDAFVSKLASAHPVDADPFATSWRPEPMAPFVPNESLRFPNVTVDLSEVSGNAYAVASAVSQALRRARVPAEQIEAYRTEALSGSYDKVLATTLAWVAVEFGGEDDEPGDEDEDELDEDGPTP